MVISAYMHYNAICSGYLADIYFKNGNLIILATTVSKSDFACSDFPNDTLELTGNLVRNGNKIALW